jgi:chaperonin cofactor prefoldin
MDQLKYGYEMQLKTVKLKEQKQQSEEHFYLKKELDETYKLIEKVLQKLENIIDNSTIYNLQEDIL